MVKPDVTDQRAFEKGLEEKCTTPTVILDALEEERFQKAVSMVFIMFRVLNT